MIFIRILCLIFLVSCNFTLNKELPEFKLIKNFSAKVEKKLGLVLWSYGINSFLPPGCKPKNGIANFLIRYAMNLDENNLVSLERARCLIVSVSDDFIKEVNADIKVRKYLDEYPFAVNCVEMRINFVNHNNVALSNGGIEGITLSKGKIKYERYEIHGYNPYPLGKHFIVHEESYTDALEIVKQQGCLDLIN